MVTAQVIEIIRGTTHDGPGMRTTVFLKGCPLNCLWCQNPEGISPGKEIWWEERKCIHCLGCLVACSSGALVEGQAGLQRDRALCTLCGACVEACPSQAMSFTSQEWPLDALFEEVLKDKDYYQAFGGGVTVSGGEPLLQYPFVMEFFKKLRQASIHTALDTCGLAPRTVLEAVLPYTDHVLFDIKTLDPADHQKYTGKSNAIIINNLAYLADTIRKINRARSSEKGRALKLWIRTPLIPDATAVIENITTISRYIHDHLHDVCERWELCAFNSLSNSKYKKLGLPWQYADYPLLGQKLVAELKAAALSVGIDAEKLAVTGLVAKE